MSESLWPHGLWPTRLLCPWDSLSKNTGVGCHSLLQGIFPTQGWDQVSCTPCTGKWVCNHCTTREAHSAFPRLPHIVCALATKTSLSLSLFPRSRLHTSAPAHLLCLEVLRHFKFESSFSHYLHLYIPGPRNIISCPDYYSYLPTHLLYLSLPPPVCSQ